MSASSSPANRPPPAAGLPCLDPERVDLLRELCADAGPEALREIVASWETEAVRHVAKIRLSLASSDTATLKAAAHALKGSCGNMGVARLAELARLLEHEVKDRTAAAPIIAEIDAELARAREQLAQTKP